MTFIRKRYYTWLIKAYVKKWKKTIISSLIFSVILFFIIFLTFGFYIKPILERKIEKIGMTGIYTLENLPEEVTQDLSYGLTSISDKGEIKPGIAEKWEVKDNGKKYIFYLKNDLKFHDGKLLTSKNLKLEFKDVKKEIINNHTVAYILKKPYTPFLVSVSKPIFIDGFSGIGKYELKKVDLNAGFIRSVTLEDKNDFRVKKIIYFYPTYDALKVSFTLGEVDKVINLPDLSILNFSFKDWKNVKYERSVDYDSLVTLFYNNNDKNLSNAKLRLALNYSLPESFSEGERAYSPILPNSIYFNKVQNYGIYDIDIAKTYLEGSGVVPGDFKIEISTTKEYKGIAEKIKKIWDELGINTKIKVVEGIPQNYQVLLYPFKPPKDPDQYTLWHSNQTNNITHYKNLRIDKLTEDGRVTSNIDERIKIYNDFQKYLLNDVPASFLYFNYVYTLQREN